MTVSFVLAVAGCNPFGGTKLTCGDSSSASARIENTGAEARTFWVGYSIEASDGRWHDISADQIELGPGEESGTGEPGTQPSEATHTSRVSVYTEEPESSTEPLTYCEMHPASGPERENFDAPGPDPGKWETTTRDLGRSKLAPENVDVEDGQLRLALPANSTDGGQVESRDLYGPGFYAARIKVPNAPSSIMGFFLYAPPDFESEVDVEIFSDSSGRIMFTTYAGGEQTNTETVELPFDPTEDFHDYAFYYNESSITFYVDGEPMTTYEGGLPDRPMKLYVNAWFPDWLSGEGPSSDHHAYVDWIEH